jgi:hypothetical protein
MSGNDDLPVGRPGQNMGLRLPRNAAAAFEMSA